MAAPEKYWQFDFSETNANGIRTGDMVFSKQLQGMLYYRAMVASNCIHRSLATNGCSEFIELHGVTSLDAKLLCTLCEIKRTARSMHKSLASSDVD